MTESGFSVGGEFTYYPTIKQSSILDGMKAAGTKWLRIDVAWSSVEAVKGQFNWSRVDATVDAAVARGISVLAILCYTPAWARPSGTTDKYGPTSPNDFANFASKAAAHLSPRGVHAYEIWNEPNLTNFWAPKPSVSNYTALLKAAYLKIKAVDLNATVLAGATSPASGVEGEATMAPNDFLKGIYKYGGKGAFDAFSHHPYSFPYMPSNTGAWNAFQQTKTLNQTMIANGDGAKKIWGTEIGAPTNGSGAVTEVQQVALYNEACDLWDQWTFTGPLFWYRWDDTGTDTANREHWFGFNRSDATPKPVMAAFTIRNKPVVEIPPKPPFDYGPLRAELTTLQSQVNNISVSLAAINSALIRSLAEIDKADAES